MPIHSAGYRAWDGRRVPGTARLVVIATTGIRRAWKSAWLRRMIFFAVLPTVFLAIPLFMFEQAVRAPGLWHDVVDVMGSLPQTQAIATTLNVDLATATPAEIQGTRHQIWSYLLFVLFRYPQAMLMVLVIGIAAPPLISNDVRSRAFMIYFSRPITRLEYILGKMGTMVFFLGMITTMPAMVLYFVGVLVSPSFSIIAATWDLPLRIVAASAMLILPTSSVALMFSSMTSESRYAGFAWYAIWILGFVMFSVVMTLTAISVGSLQEPGLKTLLSPYHTLGIVQEWVFGLATDESVFVPAAVLLTFITVASLGILYHRVSSPMRA